MSAHSESNVSLCAVWINSAHEKHGQLTDLQHMLEDK